SILENKPVNGKLVTRRNGLQSRLAFRTEFGNLVGKSNNLGNRKNYVEAVKSMPERSNSWKKLKDRKAKTEASLVFCTKKCSTDWLQGCYVGVAHSIELVPKLQETLGSKVIEKCLVWPIGHCKVLLSPERGNNFKEFIEWGRIISIDLSTALKERFDVARILISASSYEVIKEDIKVIIEDDAFLISVMEDNGGDGLGNNYPWSDKISSNSLSRSNNDCHTLYGKVQGCEVCFSSETSYEHFSPVLNQGKCLNPSEAEPSNNDGSEQPANEISGSWNRISDRELGSCDMRDFNDGLHTKKRGLSSVAVYMLAALDRENRSGIGVCEYGVEISKRTTAAEVNQCSSEGSRSSQKAQNVVGKNGSVEINHPMRKKKSLNTFMKGLMAAPMGKKVSRRAKSKIMGQTEEGSMSVSKGIDFSVASTTDSQIANVSKRVVEMREEKQDEKIWDSLTQLGIINETEDEHLMDKIEELEKNEARIAQHEEKSAARRSKMVSHHDP
ncbi:hypothetical protein Ancab_015604, partial [Ancistrocladus abbreviatus]